MKVSTTEIARICDVLLKHLESNGHETIELDWDYYWEIASPEVYDPRETPKVEALGQLTEDWEKLLEVVNGVEPPVGQSLIWLSAILRAVGEASEC